MKAPAAAQRSIPVAETAPEPDEPEMPPEDIFDDEPLDDEPQPEYVATPPPPREIAFLAFLLANEYDQSLAAMVADLLPQEVFAHDFTRRFVAAWREQTASGEDCLGPFCDGLPDCERAYFDDALCQSGKCQASSLPTDGVMRDFVRSLWAACLERRRGDLSAASTDPETVRMRLGITTALKRLRQAPWEEALKIIIQESNNGKETMK